MKKSKDILKETKQYIEFLEKRLASKNYQANVSKEVQEKEREKLKKAKLRVKLLGGADGRSQKH
jgi:uncharacterized membrane protein